MSFLSCTPTVFVIGEEYEILCNLTEGGLASISVGGCDYYEENAGTLPTDRTVVRIRVPQAALDAAGAYTVVYRKTILLRAYFPLFEDAVTETFAFTPVPKDGPVNVYYIADVHYRFALALDTVSYFGDGLHLLLANGDLGEVETEENYLEVCDFLGSATGGRVPVLMVRGNHDTRGRLAARFTDYFPAVGKNTYYTFTLPALAGVVLDCGEDKPDGYLHYDATHNGDPVYNGVNRFEAFRRRETEFLRSVNLPGDRPCIAISHICPSMTTSNPGDVFDIERELYAEWNAELERIGVDVMLSGHLHRTFVLEKHDSRALVDNPYPVIVGARPDRDNITGTAIILDKAGLTYRFTNTAHEVLEEGHIAF